MSEEKKPQGINIELSEEIAEGIYSNLAIITHSSSEFGVVKGTLFGELLSDLANNQPTPNIQQFFGQASWMPLDPFREIGFNFVSIIEKNRARAEI